jgi:hypothetical protein
MEFHRQYNLRSKKSNDNSTKKAVETKKTLDTTPKKSLENKILETSAKRTLESLPRTAQTEVAFVITPGNSPRL